MGFGVGFLGGLDGDVAPGGEGDARGKRQGEEEKTAMAHDLALFGLTIKLLRSTGKTGGFWS